MRPSPDSERLDPAANPSRIDARWRRRNALGSACAVVWILLVIVVVAVGCITHVGPFGWLSSGQLALLGSESAVLTAIPMYLLLLGLPYALVGRLPRNLDHPFLCGIQEAIDPLRAPVVRPLPGAILLRMRRLRNGALLLCGLAPLGGAVGFWIMAHSGEPAGRPLPRLSIDDVSRHATGLPRFARIIAAEDHVDRAWVWTHSTRQTRYRDYYFPLTTAGWRPQDPVALIELDKILPDDPPLGDNLPNPGGPREGALQEDAPDGWIVGEMRREGLHVVDHPVLLERRQLGGSTPGPDMIAAWVFPGIALAIAMVAGLVAWSVNRQVRVLKDREVAPS